MTIPLDKFKKVLMSCQKFGLLTKLSLFMKGVVSHSVSWLVSRLSISQLVGWWVAGLLVWAVARAVSESLGCSACYIMGPLHPSSSHWTSFISSEAALHVTLEIALIRMVNLTRCITFTEVT